MDLKLSPISYGELPSLIAYAYEGDDELLDHYLPIKKTYAQLISFITGEIDEIIVDPVYQGETNPDVHCCAITIQEADEMHAIGYVVYIENDHKPHMLHSFAINIAYRKKHILKLWLKKVEELLGEPYYTCLWNQNTRAINFFKKNGFEVFTSTKDDQKSFKYVVKNSVLLPKSILCQLTPE